MGADTHMKESILLGNVNVGEKCQISRAIIDKDVHIAPGTVIGEDPEYDKRFTVLENNIVVIPKEFVLATNPLSIAFITSEMQGLAKTGGLADVTAYPKRYKQHTQCVYHSPILQTHGSRYQASWLL